MKKIDKIKLTWVIAILISATLRWFDGTFLTPKLYNLNVGFVIFMLHLIPFVLMNFFMFWEYKKLYQLNSKDFLLFMLVAIFGGVIWTLSIVKALFLVNFDNLSVIIVLQKLQPIFAVILSAIILKEKIWKNFIIWAIIAIIASYFLSFGISIPNLGLKNIYPIILSLIAAISFGSSTVFSKKILSKYNFKTLTFYRFWLTTVIMFFLVSFFYKFQFGDISEINWIIFFVITLTTWSGAIFLYYFGLKKTKASIATICELMYPISAIIFDYILNGSRLSVVQITSVLIILIAIYQISIRQNNN